MQALTKENRVLKKNKHFFTTDYYFELDDTALLNDEETNYYQSQVSILRWMVELGHLDIYVHVALQSSYLVQPPFWQS